MDDDDKKDAVNHGWVVAARPGRGEGDDVMIEFEDGSIGWVHGHFARVMGGAPKPASEESHNALIEEAKKARALLGID